MKTNIENLSGNSLVWASAIADGWEVTNSEALRKIRLECGDEIEDMLVPGDSYPAQSVMVLRDKYGDTIDIPAEWS